MTTKQIISLPFTLDSLRIVLDMGITPSEGTHAAIAEWCDRFVSEYISEDDMEFENKDIERAYAIADEIDTAWEMNLIEKYPIEEIGTRDFSTVKLPTQLFVKWLARAQ